MTRCSKLVLAAALGLLWGCATPWDVDTYKAPEGDLTSLQSFFWRGGEFGTPTSIEPAVVDAATAQLRATITGELTRKGYREVDSAAAADMVVSFQVAGTQRSVIADERRVGAPLPSQVLSPGATQPPPASMLPREQRVRDGSVLVFIDDRATGRLLWRGGVTAQTRSGSAEQGMRTLNQMARDIVLQVPPQGR